MTCPCEKRVELILKGVRQDARAREGEYRHRIEAFQEGIRSGVEEIAVRHLFRAGVYWASFDHSSNRRPSEAMIHDALSGHVAREYPVLNVLVSRVDEAIQTGSIIDDPVQMLRKILRGGGTNIPSLLLANAKREVRVCQKALERAEQMQQRLLVWKEGVVVGNNPEAFCIVDLHENGDNVAPIASE